MLTCSMLTKTGERDHNEDFVTLVRPGKGQKSRAKMGWLGRILHPGKKSAPFEIIALCADGLGGHGGGELASECACKAFAEAAQRIKRMDAAVLGACMTAAQEAVMGLQRETGMDMKTTFTAIAESDGRVFAGHVGDTRIYRFRADGSLFQTKDHSVPQMLVSAGEIEAKDIRFHPDRNRLLKVIGIPWDRPMYAIDFDGEAIIPGDRFLMCTDGFWEWITEDEMRSELNRSKTPEAWLRRMEKIVLGRGGGHRMDNYSAVALFPQAIQSARAAKGR